MNFLSILSILLPFCVLQAASVTSKHAKRAGAVPVYQTCVGNTKMASVTFDDGTTPNHDRLVAELEKNHWPGSFFLTGDIYGCIYDHADILKRDFELGLALGSHTWNHPDCSTLTSEQFSAQLEAVEEAFIKILGVKPKLFRAPFGKVNDMMLQVLAQRGYIGAVGWSEYTGDANQAPIQQQYDAVQRTIAAPSSQILLTHEAVDSTVDQFAPMAFEGYKKNGFKVVNIAECLGLGTDPKNWYHYVGKPQAKDASWTCKGKP